MKSAAETHNFPRCIGCLCRDFNQIKVDCQESKKFIIEKLDVKCVNEVLTEVSPATAINLCIQEVVMGAEMHINYTYTEFGRQMMILYIEAPVSLVGICELSRRDGGEKRR